MPLTSEQKKSIKFTLHSFLTFSADADTFKQQTDDLIQAFKNPFNGDNPYNVIAECFFFSENKLQGLEKINPNITVAEVKTYILKYIDKKLHLAAEKTQTELTDSEWQKSKFIKKFITKKNKKQIFRSIHNAVEVEEDKPWLNVHDETDMYTFSLSLDQVTLVTTMIVTIEMENESEDVFDISVSMGTLTGNQFETDYLTELIPHAKIEAESTAKKFILQSLKTEKIISDDDFDLAMENENINCLITKKFYLAEIRTGRWHIASLLNLSAIQSENFANKAIIYLLSKNICQPKQVLPLKPCEVQAANLYQDMLNKKVLHISEFYGVTDEHIPILVLPIVKILIQKQKLKLQQALLFGIHLRALLIKPEYSNFFLTQPIDWKLFSEINKDNCHFLLQPEIISLVINAIFAITYPFTAELRAVLHRKTICGLLLGKIITPDGLKELSLHQIELIDTHTHIYDWIISNLIEIQEVTAKKLYTLYESVYAKRLFAIYCLGPCMIAGKQDCEANILMELAFVTKQEKIDPDDLIKNILSSFLKLISDNVKDISGDTYTDYEKSFFRKILRCLNNNYVEQTAVKLYDIVSSTLNEPGTRLAVSKHKPFIFFKDRSNRIEDFCNSIKSLFDNLNLMKKEIVVTNDSTLQIQNRLG